MKHQTANRPTGQLGWMIASAIAVLSIVAGCVWWANRPSYPEVSSSQSLMLMRALYTACSSQNLERLERVDRAVTEASESGEMTPPERDSFVVIITQARDGRWDEAARESYQFAESQVR
jgi:hypothetical protein